MSRNLKPELRRVGSEARDCARAQSEQYSSRAGDERPLAGYAALVAAYGCYVGGLVAIGRRRSVSLPEQMAPADLVLLAIGTHRLARTVTKDPVASPLRAPFTRFVGPTGEGEIAEEVRGRGVRHALGELLTCPFCTAQWIATTGVAGLVFAPRATRLVAGVFAVVSGADLLQLAYERARRAVS